MSCCPHCNRPFPPEIRVGGYVRQQLYEFVKSHPQGVSRQQIEDAIYATHHTGGPEHAAKSIYVMIYKINKTLQVYGMRIRAHRGAGAVYQIQTNG